MLKKILIALGIIVVVPIIGLAGYAAAYDQGLFCKPIKIMDTDTVIILDYLEEDYDQRPRQTIVSDRHNIKMLTDFLGSRKKYWRGNMAFTFHSTDYLIRIDNRSGYLGFSFIGDLEPYLFLSIGDCIQQVSHADGETFVTFLKKSGVLES